MVGTRKLSTRSRRGCASVRAIRELQPGSATKPASFIIFDATRKRSRPRWHLGASGLTRIAHLFSQRVMPNSGAIKKPRAHWPKYAWRQRTSLKSRAGIWTGTRMRGPVKLWPEASSRRGFSSTQTNLAGSGTNDSGIGSAHRQLLTRSPVQVLLAVGALTRTEHDHECGAVFHVQSHSSPRPRRHSMAWRRSGPP